MASSRDPVLTPEFRTAGLLRPRPSRRLQGATRLALSPLVVLALLSSTLFTGCGGGGGDGEKPRLKAGSGRRHRASATQRSGREEGPEDASDEDAASAGFTRYKRDAKRYLAEAEEKKVADYFPDDLHRAQRSLEQAEDLLLDGEERRAISKLRIASNSLKDLISQTEELVSFRKEVGDLKTRVEAVRARAEAAEAEKNAPDVWPEAESTMGEATASLAKKDMVSARKAKTLLQQAKDLYQQATEIAAENAKTRRLGVAEKEAMLKYKKRAQEKQADEKALSEWQFAESAERQADADFESGEFQAAVQGYKTAASQYVTALRRVSDKAELESYLANIEKQRAEAEKARAAEAAKLAARGPGSFNPLPPPPGSTGAVPPPGAGTVPAPPVVVTNPFGPSGATGQRRAACFENFDPSQYPNELDEEDEEFLTAHIGDLSPTAAATYDPVTGQVELDYAIGRKVKKEAEIATKLTPRNHLEWEDFSTRGQTIEDVDAAAFFSVGGNTRGLVWFPVPFLYNLRISYKLNILTMTGNGRFGPIFCFDPKKSSYYQADFLTLQRVRGGSVNRKPMPGKKFAKNANYWHDKTRQVPWIVEFLMPDPEKAARGAIASSRISATYDAGGDDEAINSLSAGKSVKGGYVGFEWSETKFRVWSLKICGILDKKVAVVTLRKKLGIPKGSGKKKSGDSGSSGEDSDTGGIEPVSDV